LDFTAEASAIRDRLVVLRRELHAHPETDTDTVWTADRIAAELDAIDVPYTRLADNQIVGRIGSGSGPSIALRADMDGLPLTEDTGLPFASTNGAMHACGHDGHMAMLVGAALLLKEAQAGRPGTIHLCFQSAEETGRGWDRILDHLAESGGVDQAIALHLWADLDIGTISVVSGPRMAGVERFEISIRGRGGHGSRPDLAIDPIKPAAATVLAVSAIPSNMANPLDPAVVHVGQLNAGTTFNVFPSVATIDGQLRYFTPAMRKTIKSKIEQIAKNTAQAYGANADIVFNSPMPPVVNEAESVRQAEQIIDNMPGLTNVEFEQITASENFSQYLEIYPGFMAYLGIKNPTIKQFYHHHPKFDIDEDALTYGAEFLARYAYQHTAGKAARQKL
jgi:amidohydrolase